MSEKLKIAIADDHTLFRQGMKAMLELEGSFEVAFMVGNNDELIEVLEAGATADILILDIRMPGKSGIEILPELVKGHNLKVLMISMYGEPAYILNAMKRGACGYLEKEADAEEVFRALKSVYKTDYYLNEEMTRIVMKGLAKRHHLTYETKPINPQEIETLEYICMGYSAKEISVLEWKSHRTVEGIRQTMFKKTGTKNIATLVAWAFREGIVE
jgi:DNA-binding NarL/FixJ family response regulator